jgi:hypothetical protein
MLVLISSRLDVSEKDELLIYSWPEDDKIISKKAQGNKRLKYSFKLACHLEIVYSLQSRVRLSWPSEAKKQSKSKAKAKQSKADPGLHPATPPFCWRTRLNEGLRVLPPRVPLILLQLSC